MKKAFKNLKRIELVELIYQLRKDNIALRQQCKELTEQLQQAEDALQSNATHSEDEILIRVKRIESMLMEAHKTDRR